MLDDEVVFEWRGRVGDNELSILHAAAFAHAIVIDPWNHRLTHHSLGWVTARRHDRLVGFVNVTGDGGRHAFLLDTSVAPDQQRAGIGRALVREAISACRLAEVEWIHVDFELQLEAFYLENLPFRSTRAGVVHVPDVR